MTEQKKGGYKYFVDMGDRMEVAEPRTAYAYKVNTCPHLKPIYDKI